MTCPPPVSNWYQHQLLSARELASKHKVSIRTARRWRAAGVEPRHETLTGFYGPIPARTIGSDGKSYPRWRTTRYNVRGGPSAFKAALRLARHALRKIEAAAGRGFTDADLRELEKIADRATELTVQLAGGET
jgi:hypothetical protein